MKAAILIHLNSRCCSYHLTDSKFLKKEEYNNLKSTKDNSQFTKSSLENLFQGFRTREERTCSVFARFGELSNIENEFCLQITSHSKDEFILINSYVKSLKNSPKRTKEQALAVYLFWLTTGSTQNLIALFFGFKAV